MKKTCKSFGVFLKTLFCSALFSIGFYATAFAADVTIDKSKAESGIVSVKYALPLSKAIKVQIAKDNQTYNYSILNNNATNFPLQMGAGKYLVKVLENVSGNSYRVIASDDIAVNNYNEAAVYTNSIQLINFNDSMASIKALNGVSAGAQNQEERVKEIYNYVISNISYDFDKAASLPADYIPVIDQVYNSKKGICYDYASLFASALRDNDIPTKLQMGYFTEIKEYHAWNEVYLNGKWQKVDCTYDAQAKQYKMSFSMVKDNGSFKVLKQY